MDRPLRTDVLVLGDGPGPVLAAQILACSGVRSVLADHELADDVRPVCLTPASVTALEAGGLLAAVRVCTASGDPLVTSPAALEAIVLRHCVADICVTVYDRLRPAALTVGPDGEVAAVLTDGQHRWDVRATGLVDARSWPAALDDAIGSAADAVRRVLARLHLRRRRTPATAFPRGGNAHPTGG